MTVYPKEYPENYDVEGWADFYARNPDIVRAVGADVAAVDAAPEADGEADAGEPAETPAEAETPETGKEQEPGDKKPTRADDLDPDKDKDDQPTAWRDRIKDKEARKAAEDSPDIDHLARRLVDMRKQLSKAVTVPGKDATDEEKAAFAKALGVPEAPDKYEFPEIEDMSEEQQENRKLWAERFHDLNVPAETAKKLAEMVHEDEQRAIEEMNKRDEEFAKESLNELKQDWGEEYGKNREFASRALQRLSETSGVDFEELRNIEMKGGQYLLDDAKMLRVLATVGREMGEGTLGVVSEEDADTVHAEIERLETEMQEAQSKGDTRRANQLYQRQQGLYAKLPKK